MLRAQPTYDVNILGADPDGAPCYVKKHVALGYSCCPPSLMCLWRKMFKPMLHNSKEDSHAMCASRTRLQFRLLRFCHQGARNLRLQRICRRMWDRVLMASDRGSKRTWHVVPRSLSTSTFVSCLKKRYNDNSGIAMLVGDKSHGSSMTFGILKAEYERGANADPVGIIGRVKYIKDVCQMHTETEFW